MESPRQDRLLIGAWHVDPTAGCITKDGETVRVEARTLRLLLCLAERAGEVVSLDALLDQVWPDVTVTPDSVYQAVTSLRRVLGDDPKAPRYIATAPRRGYRLVAAVGPWNEAPAGDRNRAPRASRGRIAALSAAVVLCAGLGAAVWANGQASHPDAASLPARVAPTPISIAVMPFLDLTDDMDQEPFADGITEELIDQLSRNPGLRVASPRSSFQFKGKPTTAGEVSTALGVAYVLDGSVRRSAQRLRIATRLVRADNGFVAWSQSYDRPFGDLLWVQEDIAGEVAKALGGGAIPRPDLASAPVAP